MTSELDKARAALAEAGDTDMDNIGHLRAAFAEVDLLTAALKAERMDVLACGSNLVNEYLAKHGGAATTATHCTASSGWSHVAPM